MPPSIYFITTFSGPFWGFLSFSTENTAKRKFTSTWVSATCRNYVALLPIIKDDRILFNLL